MVLIVAFAVAAAFSNAVNVMTQHAASAGAPKREKGWRLVSVWVAVLMKVAIRATTFGIGGMLTRWPVYALAAAAVTGTLLEQSALHVGPLSVSQPLLVMIDPLASIILGIWLFDERFTDSPAKIAIAGVAFAVMAAGVIVLSRTAPKDLTPSRPARS